jgi:hypothetical protein
MDYLEREFLVDKIISGVYRIEVEGSYYLVKHPDALTRCKAHQIYNSVLSDCAYETFFSQEEALSHLEKAGIFTQEDETKLTKLTKDIEELKYQLYTSMLNAEKSKFVRKTLARVRHEIIRLNTNKTSFDYTTVEGYASMVKSQYLMFNTLCHDDGTRVYTGTYDSAQKYRLLEQAIFIHNAARVGDKQIRELARTDPWLSFWGAGKHGVFSVTASEMTLEQRSLVMYTKMYSSANEHPESPSDEVVADDDLFDGWMISNRRKNEKTKKHNEVDNMISPKQRNAGELFIVASSNDDAKKIESLNSLESQVKVNERKKFLKKAKKGQVVRDANLPDRKRQIQIQANQEFAEKFKSG